jgi:hypothetical protein
MVTGELSGLSKRWRHGSAELALGRITFRPGIAGSRLPRRDSVVISDVRLLEDNRNIAGFEAWSVAAGFPVLRMETGQVTVEWLLPPEELRWAIRKVFGTDAAP